MVSGRVAARKTTETYPRELRRYQSGSDPIAALGVVGTGIALPMLAVQDSFTLGRAATCDLSVDQRYLASVHARIERIVSSSASVRVTNVSNGKNDIVHNGAIAALSFTMGAGEWFAIGDSRYYALNEEMRLKRITVMERLGIRQYRTVDEFLIAAVKDSARPILLLGEPGCDQERLGRVIHQISHRRHNTFDVLPDRARLDSATRETIFEARSGTVLVHLHHRGKLDARLVEALARQDADLRLIVCARSLDKVEASFPASLVSDAKKIMLPPLRERASEIPELLDRWFITRHAPLRFAALRKGLRDTILSYTWPENFQELAKTAEYLVQLARCRSGRQAIKDSLVTRAELRSWTTKLQLKLEFPLVPDKVE